MALYTLQDRLISPDYSGNNTDAFGFSVSLSTDGNTALVGARQESPYGVTASGAAYIYVRVGTSWVLQARLVSPDYAGNTFDFFGWSVSLSGDGNTALIGSIGEDPYGATEAGAAYVYVRSGTTWTLQTRLISPDYSAGDEFGYSVSLSANGNTALIGARGEDPYNITNAGSAYVYIRSGTTWSLQATLVSPEYSGNPFDNFGVSVSVSSDGSTALIGSIAEDPYGATNAGAAYIYVRTGTVWSLQATLVSPDYSGNANDQFGSAVTLSGDGNTALIGAPLEDPYGATDVGSVYVYTRAGTVWTLQARLISPDYSGNADVRFGTSVSLSSNGNTALIGSGLEDPYDAAEAGAAYTFTRSGTTWTFQSRIISPDYSGIASDQFGTSVALSGDASTLLIGSPNEDAYGATNSGEAYVYSIIPQQLLYIGNKIASSRGKLVINVNATTIFV